MSDEAPSIHPGATPLLEALQIASTVPHDVQLGCFVLLFRGNQMRLVIDESLDLTVVAQILEQTVRDMRSQVPRTADPDTPLDGGTVQ